MVYPPRYIRICMAADDPAQYVKTTVIIREDFYQRLKRSPKGLSRTLNDILAKAFPRDHSMFGTAPRDIHLPRDSRPR